MFLFKVEVGQTRTVNVLINGKLYQANLKNLPFDRNVYPDHCDIMQIRYSRGSAIAKELRSIFFKSNNYFESQLELLGRTRQHISLPDDINEYISFEIYDKDTFQINCFTSDENIECLSLIKGQDELQYEVSESTLNALHDNSAGYSLALQRVRHLNRLIGDGLKKLYDNRCQVTGEQIGTRYGTSVVEAHHIQYFTTSLNNDADNIILVNPSFHRIIHRTHPEFDRDKLCFRFPNGVEEKVILDKHLRIV